jgi:RimJ/RimL family protein N-acetyltransferase
MGGIMLDSVEAAGSKLSLRPPQSNDVAVIVASRDDESRKWLGPGSDSPSPAACIVVGDEVVGWADYDHDAEHDWLQAHEVNLGYCVFPQYRGNGYAAKAVELLLGQIRDITEFRVASLLIDNRNAPSLAVARRCRFTFVGEVRGQLDFRRFVQ